MEAMDSLGASASGGGGDGPPPPPSGAATSHESLDRDGKVLHIAIISKVGGIVRTIVCKVVQGQQSVR